MTQFMQPPLMAIGDSLYQGVRSLTIRAEMMRLSAPRQIAEALGLGGQFAVPQPEHPIITNMEYWLHQFPDFGQINRDLKSSVRYWRRDPVPADGRTFHDNIAVASARYDDLIGLGPLGLTRNQSQTWLDAVLSPEDWDKLESVEGLVEVARNGVDVATLVMALNTRFTLCPNPAADPHGLSGLTPVQQVELRRPERLLVNIGSNQGLWEMGFGANKDVVFDTYGLAELADQLNATDVPHIYFNGLGLPSTVANLMPVDYLAFTESPVDGHYYDRYENRFGFDYGTLSGAEIEELDTRIRRVNEQVRQTVIDRFTNPDRLHFVAVADVLIQYDAKHDWPNNSKAVRVADGHRLTNVTTETGPFFPLPRLKRGGLFGLDGMHLSAVGYGLMAQRVLDAIREAEGKESQPIDPEKLYDEDQLLSDAPRSWSYLLWAWRDIRRGLARNVARDALAAKEEASSLERIMTPLLQTRPGGDVR